MHTLKNIFKYLFFAGAIFLLLPNIKAQDSISVTPKIRISGQVMDARNGNPLPGINVEIPGYSSAMTNDSGYFKLRVPNLNVTVYISGIDYHNVEVPIQGKSNIKVLLYEEPASSFYDKARFLQGETSLAHTTGSVSSINLSNSSWSQSSANVSNNINGKIAGMEVISRSGAVGIGSELLLRGYSSLYTNNRPLIVVDGTVYDMNAYGNSIIDNYYYDPLADIDPRDIENITVSKDNNSIYGSKGGNGVIYITTTHTKDAATKIEFNASGGINFAPKEYPVLNSSDFRTYLSELLSTKGLSSSEIDALSYMDDNTSNSEYYMYHNNTNWQDKVFENSSSNQNYYLKITGGDENAHYNLSLGYLNQNGIIKETKGNRFNVRFNGDIDITNKLKLSSNLSFANNNRDLKGQGLNEKTNPIFMSLIKAPFLHTNAVNSVGYVSPTLADVDVFNIGNPVAIIDKMKEINKNYRFLASVKLTYEVNKNFHINSVFGLTYDKDRESSFKPHLGVVADTLESELALRTSALYSQSLINYYNDTWLQYSKTLNSVHELKIVGGFRYQYNKDEYDIEKSYNAATDDLTDLDNGTKAPSSGSTDRWNWLNMYASADYSFESKYFLNASLGIDGSSRFGQDIDKALKIGDNKYGVFPSVGAAWLVSSEKFMANAPYLSMLKLRANYSISGNDDVGNYNSQELYTSKYLYLLSGMVRANIANTAIQWETNKKMNFGADLGLMNDRVKISVDIYKYKTDNMLTNETPASYVGVDNIETNNGAMETNGMEYTLSGRILNGPVKWDMGFSIAFNKTKITKLPADSVITSFGGATLLSAVGKSASVFYGYKTNGIYVSDAVATSENLQNEMASGTTTAFEGGDVRFVDNHADGVINGDDRVEIGNPNPDFFGSFNTDFKWKNISLSALFTYSYGNDIFNYTRYRLESMSGYENQTPAVMNRWRTDGQVTDMPHAVWGDPQGNNRFSDRWIEDGSYIRLKVLTLSYDVPVKTQYFKNLTIYASAYNLLTLTKYMGFDPEFSAGSSIFSRGADVGMVPQYKSVMAGFKIGL
jgi:TonB-linked SusC/RagA family outer membrane protein